MAGMGAGPDGSARHADAAPPCAGGAASADGADADDGAIRWEESHPKAVKFGCRSWASDATPA